MHFQENRHYLSYFSITFFEANLFFICCSYRLASSSFLCACLRSSSASLLSNCIFRLYSEMSVTKSLSLSLVTISATSFSKCRRRGSVLGVKICFYKNINNQIHMIFLWFSSNKIWALKLDFWISCSEFFKWFTLTGVDVFVTVIVGIPIVELPIDVRKILPEFFPSLVARFKIFGPLDVTVGGFWFRNWSALIVITFLAVPFLLLPTCNRLIGVILRGVDLVRLSASLPASVSKQMNNS